MKNINLVKLKDNYENTGISQTLEKLSVDFQKFSCLPISESRVYTAMSLDGKTSYANRIADISGVHRSKVYSSLDVLKQLGYVNSTQEKYGTGLISLYSAIPINDSLRMIENEYDEQICNMKKSANYIVSQINNSDKGSITKTAQDLTPLFEEFGLTEAQTKVYVPMTFMKDYLSTVEISELSKAKNRTKTYRTLEELSDVNAVLSQLGKEVDCNIIKDGKVLKRKIINEKTMYYKAVNPESFLDAKIRQYENIVEEARIDIRDFKKNFDIGISLMPSIDVKSAHLS